MKFKKLVAIEPVSLIPSAEKKLYEYAREGIDIELPKRKVEIKEIELLDDIEYKNNEVLYVPLEQFSLVRKYATRDGKAPTLNKLGSGDWEKTKARIKEKVKDLAVNLIKLYEERVKEFKTVTKEEVIDKDFFPLFIYLFNTHGR